MFRLPTTLNLTGRRKTRDRLDGGSALHVCHRPYLLPTWNYNPAVRGLAIDCREHGRHSCPSHGRNDPLNAEPAGSWEFHAESLAVDWSSDEEMTEQKAPLARGPSGAL